MKKKRGKGRGMRGGKGRDLTQIAGSAPEIDYFTVGRINEATFEVMYNALMVTKTQLSLGFVSCR